MYVNTVKKYTLVANISIVVQVEKQMENKPFCSEYNFGWFDGFYDVISSFYQNKVL